MIDTKSISSRYRIFTALFFLVIISSIIIAGIYITKLEKTNDEHRFYQFNQKVARIKFQLEYLISQHSEKVTSENAVDIIIGKVFELSDNNHINIDIYDIDGMFLASSSPLANSNEQIPHKILKEIRHSDSTRLNFSKIKEKSTYLSSYTYIFNKEKDPIAILNLPYFSEGNTLFIEKLEQFLKHIGVIYLFLLISIIIMGYYLYKRMIKTLGLLKESLSNINIVKQNNNLQYAKNDEIKPLVTAYNQIAFNLEKTSDILIRKEKETAWCDIAKQVAHEVKNLLTPMRLMAQNFVGKINKSEDIKKEIKDFSFSMIQQIDTLSSIAYAFSEFAKMPITNDEIINFDEVVECTLEIFDSSYLKFNPGTNGVTLLMDRTHLVRIITNLINNAVQSIPSSRVPEILVSSSLSDSKAILSIRDNGVGISPRFHKPIFDSQFTTKSDGVGLGLPIIKRIIKDYRGRIYFESEVNIGTTFFVELPVK